MPDGRGPAMTGRLDSMDSYNPARYRGGVLRLHYARAAELESWLDLVAARGEVGGAVLAQAGGDGGDLGAGGEKGGGADTGAVEKVFGRGTGS